jgi:hypothetical protein
LVRAICSIKLAQNYQDYKAYLRHQLIYSPEQNNDI